MTYSIASESLGGGVCFQACLLVCKGLGCRHRGTFYRQFHRFVALRQMSSKLQSQKNGGHFKRRVAIGRRNKPHLNYIAQI